MYTLLFLFFSVSAFWYITLHLFLLYFCCTFVVLSSCTPRGRQVWGTAQHESDNSWSETNEKLVSPLPSPYSPSPTTIEKALPFANLEGFYDPYLPQFTSTAVLITGSKFDICIEYKSCPLLGNCQVLWRKCLSFHTPPPQHSHTLDSAKIIPEEEQSPRVLNSSRVVSGGRVG